jgi:transcriptional regulator with XRE-family HTH domain
VTGAQFKAIRALRGMTQQELAKKSGITQASISSFEAGTHEIRTDTLRKICKALDVEISYIVGNSVFKS